MRTRDVMNSLINKIWQKVFPSQVTPTVTTPPTVKVKPGANRGHISTMHSGETPHYAKSGRISNQRGVFGGCNG